jgi:chromosome segregation ATPase
MTPLGPDTSERTASPLRAAPSRRISASVTDAASRALASFEAALAALTTRLDQVEAENAALRQEAVAREARVTELLETSNAALAAQAATISSLTAELAKKASCDEVSGLAAALKAQEASVANLTEALGSKPSRDELRSGLGSIRECRCGTAGGD